MMGENKMNVGRDAKVLKISIWIGGIVLICLLGIIGGSWYLQTKLPKQLKSLVHEKSQGGYQLEFDKLTLSLLKGSLYLENVNLKPDTQVLTKGSNPNVHYGIQAKAEKVRFSGMKILRFLSKKDIAIGSILIEKPDIILYQMSEAPEKDSVKMNLFDRVPDFLKGTKLGEIIVNELSFTMRKVGQESDSVNTLSGLSFSIEDIDLVENALLDSSRTWFSKDIKIWGKELRFTLSDGPYLLKAENLVFSTKEKSLGVDSFKVIPMDKELEFSGKLKHQRSRYDVALQVQLEGIEVKKWEQEGKLFAKALTLKNGNVDIFNDKRVPSIKQKVIRNAPHLALQRLKIPIFLDSLKVDSLDLHYREFNPKSNKIGDVFFAQMTGGMTNITNDTAALAKNHWARSYFEMRFLDQSNLKVNLDLNLISPTGAFNYKGSLGPSSAAGYNQILEPLALVKVDQGYINGVTFDVKANLQGSNGTVKVLYKDLKVSVLVKENSGKVGKAGLFSFLANTFLITPNNPIPGLPVKSTNFHYVHTPYRSFFNLMWKGVFEGIKENIIETKEQKQKDKAALKEIKKKEKARKKAAKESAKE